MASSKAISTVTKSRMPLRTLAVLACIAAAVVALDELFPVFARSNPQAVADLSAVHTGQDEDVSHPVARIDEEADEAVSNVPNIYCVNPATCIVDQSYAGDDADGTWQSPFRKFRYGIAEAHRWGKGLGVTATVIISPGHYAAVGVYTYPTRLEAPAGGVVLESFPELKGDTSCEWGSANCNPCVNNVTSAFENLRDHGDVMGFHLGWHPQPLFDPIWSREPHSHFQGVQRIMPGEGIYMVVTQDEIPYHDLRRSGFAIVKLGTRGTGGYRFRSNRLVDVADIDNTAPNSADIVVDTVNISSNQVHPGGIQAMGEILAVGTGSTLHFYNLFHYRTLF